jgi:hypothetical protein
MGTIRDAASQPVTLDLRPRFDNSLLHFWVQEIPTGEWEHSTTVIRPACTPSERRVVPTLMVNDAERIGVCQSDVPKCAVCAEVEAS